MLDELCKAVSDCVLNHHPAMSPWLLTASLGLGEYRAPSPEDPNEHITPCFLSNSLPFTAGLGKLEVIFERVGWAGSSAFPQVFYQISCVDVNSFSSFGNSNAKNRLFIFFAF